MAKASTYDFKKVVLVVDGRIHTGFMDGAPITSEPSTDKFIPHVGADGSVGRAISADNTGTITVTYRHDSPSLSHVRSLYKSGKQFSISLDDQNDPKLKVGGADAVVLRMPPTERGTEYSGVEVVYHIADYDAK